MLKKHMIAGPKTQKIAHKGKGSQSASMPDRSQIASLSRPGSQSINDYAKATPMAQSPMPMPEPEGGF